MIFDSETRLPSRSGWDLHPTRAETGSFTIGYPGTRGECYEVGERARPPATVARGPSTPAELKPRGRTGGAGASSRTLCQSNMVAYARHGRQDSDRLSSSRCVQLPAFLRR